MYRTQFYDPSIDPERPEFYNVSSPKTGYKIFLKDKTFVSVGSKFWFFYKSSLWSPLKSCACRFLMIVYSIFLIHETSNLFDEKCLWFCASFLILILIDGLVVIILRQGLEDRWCSLSLIFFICSNTTPLWMLEINYGIILSSNVFNPDHVHHIESHYREINNSTIVLNNLKFGNETVNVDIMWSEILNKESYSSIIEKHEALFCLVLVICRIFIPQATLTWSAVSTQSEFTFNTIFDIYSTISMCRDARLNLPKYISILTIVISNGALFPIALNIFPDSDSYENLRISKLRQLTDNFYFRLIAQMMFADVPFLVLRFVILTNLKYVRNEMYYLIAKQIIIIFCKITLMTYNLIKNNLLEFSKQQLNQLNNSSVIY